MQTMENKVTRTISANILLLGIVSFLNDLSSEMIIPILPMFIAALGGAGLAVGLIGGLRDSISSILKVLCGYWSDRAGKRKVFVSSGYLTSAIFKLLLTWSSIWQHVLVFAGLERIGKGLRTAPRDAIISDSMPHKRGRGFGIHRTLDTSGAIAGSVLVFVLFWFSEFNFKSIILIAAGVAFLSLIPLYRVEERPKEPQETALRISLVNLPRSLKLFIIVSSIFSLANFSYMFFILRAKDYFTAIGGPVKSSVGMPILLYVLFNIFYAIFSIPFGLLSDKIGRERVIAGGYFLFSLTSLGFALFNSPIAFAILFALYGMVHAIVDGNQRALVSDLSSPDLRATALGTYHTSIGLAALPASLIAGSLWQIKPSMAFIYGASMSIVSVILFLVFCRTPISRSMAGSS